MGELMKHPVRTFLLLVLFALMVGTAVIASNDAAQTVTPTPTALPTPATVEEALILATDCTNNRLGHPEKPPTVYIDVAGVVRVNIFGKLTNPEGLVWLDTQIRQCFSTYGIGLADDAITFLP